tara:strand:+ start:473 stop:1648 length:1176 start_codon:yes stop_codon:yes gene_type:complete
MATRGFLLSEVDSSLIRKRKGNIVERGAVQKRSDTQQDPFAKVKRDSFATDILSYPSELGNVGQGHYLMFYINDQKHANVAFGNNVKIQPQIKTTKIEMYKETRLGGTGFGGNPKSVTETKTREVPVTIPNDVTKATNDFIPKEQQDRLDAQTKSSVSVDRAPTVRLATAIGLYMPAEITNDQSIDYGEPDIGGLAKMLNAFSTEFLQSGSFQESFGAMQGDLKTSLAETAKTALNEVAPGAKAAAEIRSGRVFSNRLETVFTGINKREFSFDFRMLPKDESEARTIDKIVRMFRFYAAPSFEGDEATSRTFIVPATFNIEYRMFNGNTNMFLNKIATSVCTGVSVKYGGDRATFFRPTDDGEGAPPIETNLSLKFREIELITREKINAGY